MSKNLIEDFIFGVKRNIIFHKLQQWKKQNTSVTSNTLKHIKPEYHDLARNMYIRRSIEGSDIFVDIYWYLKRSEHTSHEDYIYHRCNWTVAQKLISKVERTELPECINRMFDTDKDAK